eukprot:5999519-Amphidinium_carterae.1
MMKLLGFPLTFWVELQTLSFASARSRWQVLSIGDRASLNTSCGDSSVLAELAAEGLRVWQQLQHHKGCWRLCVVLPNDTRVAQVEIVLVRCDGVIGTAVAWANKWPPIRPLANASSLVQSASQPFSTPLLRQLGLTLPSTAEGDGRTHDHLVVKPSKGSFEAELVISLLRNLGQSPTGCRLGLMRAAGSKWCSCDALGSGRRSGAQFSWQEFEEWTEPEWQKFLGKPAKTIQQQHLGQAPLIRGKQIRSERRNNKNDVFGHS